jgi:uncharacterized cupin superfamily protein
MSINNVQDDVRKMMMGAHLAQEEIEYSDAEHIVKQISHALLLF